MGGSVVSYSSSSTGSFGRFEVGSLTSSAQDNTHDVLASLGLAQQVIDLVYGLALSECRLIDSGRSRVSVLSPKQRARNKQAAAVIDGTVKLLIAKKVADAVRRFKEIGVESEASQPQLGLKQQFESCLGNLGLFGRDESVKKKLETALKGIETLGKMQRTYPAN